VPQRERRSLFATAIIEHCVKYRQKIGATISRVIYARRIEYVSDQLIGTTRDNDDKLLVVDTARGLFNIKTRSINTFENNSSRSCERVERGGESRKI
jgi:hypothetical protein